MKAKYFLVHFRAEGMEPLVAVGLTRSLVARAMKRQYGNRAIKKIVPTSRDGSVGYGHAPSSWAQMSALSGTNPFMREETIGEAGYMDPPKTEDEIKKKNLDKFTTNKDGKIVRKNQLQTEAAEDKKQRVVEAMGTLLGTSYALQVKTQNFHWNIQGPDFIQYHTYLGEFYDLVSGHIDKIAEQIRTLDAKAPASLSKFLELSEIEEATDIPEALEMLNQIQRDVDILIATLEEANDEAEHAGKTGLANYLQDTIDQFSKQNWFLKSIQGRSLNESTITSMVSEAAVKLEGQLIKKHRIEGTLSQKPKLVGKINGVRVNSDSPDVNGDGTVDDKDDANGDGVVDSKDLLIMQLEKDVRIRELQARLEELDDPVAEQEAAPVPDMPMRLRIKDRGTHFECIDEMGNCVQEFVYDNQQKYAKDARYEAQRFAEKHWHEACGKMKREQVMKSGTVGEKKRVKLKEMSSLLLSKKSNQVTEGNAFIYAAKRAKAAGKKSFEFNGKTYKVTLKEDEQMDQYMTEAFDADKLTLLAKAGMVSRDQISVLKLAMKTMEAGDNLKPAHRQVIIDLFGKLADLVTNDQAVFQKAKKFAKEDVETTQDVEQVDELSRTTLQRYHDKAKAASNDKNNEKRYKHGSGATKASDRIHKGKYSREEVTEKELTPAEKKKREEIAQAIEKDEPGMDMSKKMAIATAQAKKVAEGVSSVYSDYISKTIRR